MRALTNERDFPAPNQPRGIAVTGTAVPRWGCESHQLIRKGKSMTILTVGIDLAKDVFAAHGINEAGRPDLRLRSAAAP